VTNAVPQALKTAKPGVREQLTLYYESGYTFRVLVPARLSGAQLNGKHDAYWSRSRFPRERVLPPQR